MGHPKQTAQKWYRIPSPVARAGPTDHTGDGRCAAITKWRAGAPQAGTRYMGPQIYMYNITATTVCVYDIGKSFELSLIIVSFCKE